MIDYKALAAEVREMRLGHKVFGGTLEILEALLEGMADAPSFADRLKAECKRIGDARVEKWAKLDCEDMVEQAKADAVTGYSMLQWIKLTDRMPNPDEHGRVLIFTEGYDFNGEQVFDVKAETLNECFYADPDDQPEVCRVASHWMPHPTAVLKGESEPTEAQITERHVSKAYALCPLDLATPERYRWIANYLNEVLRAALAAKESK